MTARVYPSQQDTYLTAIGSLLVTYEEINQETNVSQVQCFVNSVERKLIHNNTDKLYSTFISNGDIVRILITTTSANNEINVTRRDYTTDDQGGDMGIRDVYITGVTGYSPTTLEVTFTVSPITLDYNFEYLISASVQYPATPTPTPTITPTSTPIPAPFIFDISIGSGESFTLPYYSGATYNGLINWGDTTSSTNSYANKSHTYSVGGTYTITISGTISQWSFYHVPTNAQNITGIRQWGSLQFLNNDGRYFFLCRSLSSIIATDAPNLIGVTNLGDMFAQTYFNTSLNNWNVSGITNMAGMFTGANQFNGNITSWNVSNVTTMQSMFNGAFAFNQNIGSWNVSNVTNMSGMFLGAQQFNQNIGSWNVSNVTTMQQMFYAAYSFNQNISNWSVNNVINMQQLFEDAVSFNQNLSNWCAVNIPSEPYNFAVGATSYILPRPNWGCLTSTPTPTPTSTSVTPTPTPTVTPTSVTPTPTPTPTPTNPPFSPNNLTGLTFWTDFSDNSFYTTSGSSIINVYSKVNGSTTHTLNRVNSSNNYYELVTSLSNTGRTSAKVVTRPTTYRASSWNTADNAAIVFGPKTNTTSYPDGTMFVVLNRGTISTAGYLLSRYYVLSDRGVIYDLATGTPNTNIISYDQNSPAYLYYNTTGTTNVILTRENYTDTATIYNGSTQQASGIKNDTQDRTFRQFHNLGMFGSPTGTGDTTPVNTYYCEVIIYNRVLTAGEKTQVWNYLSTKWNITL